MHGPLQDMGGGGGGIGPFNQRHQYHYKHMPTSSSVIHEFEVLGPGVAPLKHPSLSGR